MAWGFNKDFIRGCTTAGFSGLLWQPEVRRADSKEEFLRRTQSTVFSAQCVLDGWYSDELPWKTLDCEKEIKALLEERERLMPRLKKAFESYTATGLPPMRALVSDYTDDAETDNIDDEYIFCDHLVVAPILIGQEERKVYLPAGEWGITSPENRLKAAGLKLGPIQSRSMKKIG